MCQYVAKVVMLCTYCTFSVLDEPSSHTYDVRDEKVEMQQFDKHRYYLCKL